MKYLPLALLLTTCTAPETARFARAWSVSYSDGGGTFDTHGVWKANEDVWRGHGDGSMDTWATTVTFDFAALIPDPELVRLNANMERALRARDTAPPRPLEPDPCTTTSTERPICPHCKRH